MQGCARLTAFNVLLTCSAVRNNAQLVRRCDGIEQQLRHGAEVLSDVSRAVQRHELRFDTVERKCVDGFLFVLLLLLAAVYNLPILSLSRSPSLPVDACGVPVAQGAWTGCLRRKGCCGGR